MTLSELRQWHIEQALRYYELVVKCNRSLATRALYTSMLSDYRAARFHEQAANTVGAAMHLPIDDAYNHLRLEREAAFSYLKQFAEDRGISFRNNGFDILR
ncbi:hypothetical protein JXVLWARM_CDS_0083 [Burkholderia phage Bm1]